MEYQIVNASKDVDVIALPKLKLRTTTDELFIDVPDWPITVGAITASQVRNQGGLLPLQPDRPAPTIATDAIRHRLQLEHYACRWAEVVLEDVTNCERIQRGLESRAKDTMILQDAEMLIRHSLHVLDKWVKADRVADAQKSQTTAKAQFASALEHFLAVTKTSGGGADKATEVLYVPFTLQATKGPWTLKGDVSWIRVAGPALLLDGDSVHVPRYNALVSVSGAVNSAVALPYEPGASLSSYIRAAGGAPRYAAAKRAMVEDWLAAQALTGAPLRFYSDHPSDAPMFELADEAVAANPNRALRAMAVARGWAVVDWE